MKHYLTGIDWVINSIDYIGKARSGIGNISEVVMELSGQPDRGVLAQKLGDFIREFPCLNGEPSRDFNLCPYWKVFPRKKMPPAKIHFSQIEDGENPLPLLEARANEPFTHKREHLVFNIINAGKRSFLALVFDHRILDARGAEAFLNLFQSYYQGLPFPRIVLDEPPHLDRWKEKFIAGRQVNRVFLDLAGEARRTLPAPARSRVCKFKVIHLDPAKTSSFTDAAYANAGYLMVMPYALAKSMQSMHRVFEARNIPGSTYIIPVSIDTRPQEYQPREVFFNYVSFFIFKIKADSINDLSALLASIKEQMYEQVKSGLPGALKNASFLLRIAPLSWVNFFLQCMSKKQFAAFSFSFVGSAYSAPAFMDAEVRNIFHFPRVPNPPGIGIFFNHFNNRINATLSYFEGTLNDVEAQQVMRELASIGNEG